MMHYHGVSFIVISLSCSQVLDDSKTFLEISIPVLGEFHLAVNQNQDFWYEEAIEGEKYGCGDDGYGGDQHYLLDIREIGTSSVIPVVDYAEYADCWWHQASNIQAIDSAGDAWQVLHRLTTFHPSL